MVAAHSRWRAVAETSDLTSVVGPRVRFLCLDANETHVVLGANTGSLYVFARRRASADATEDPSSDAAARDADAEASRDERDAAEGPLRFLTMLSPADAPPIEPLEGTGGSRPARPETGPAPDRGASRRSVTPALVRAKLHPGGGMCAAANAAGVVQVLAFPFSFVNRPPRDEADGSAEGSPLVTARSSPGRVVVQIPHGHAGKRVTWLEWSADGRLLASGDDGGALCVTDITAPEAAPETSRADAAPRYMTPTELLTTAAVTRVFETKSPVTQASFDAAGAVAAVSTAEAAFVISLASGIRPRLGAKPRVGPFGACFHARASDAAVARAPADGTRSDAASGASGSDPTREKEKNAVSWLIAARPGRRLWVAETWLDEDSAPVTRVAATLRPAVPPPSPAPGADATSGSDAKPRKFEFGAIRPLGDVCALAVCDRALAVLDVPNGAMLDVFPTGDPSARDVAFGARDVATSGAKAFVLAEKPGVAAVWCLEAPASALELARAVADAADADGGAEAATLALLTATRLRVAEAGALEDARARFAALARSAETATPDARGSGGGASPESLRELASALEAYEAFVATVPADARPRPRRKPKARSVREEETSRGGFVPSAFARAGPERASAPERAAPERVVSRGAPAFTAPAFAKASSRAPAAAEAEGAPADAYPPAASSTKFFFYNPHSGFVRNGREDGGGESAAAEASAREASRPAETAARRRARIVDDIAPAPETSPEDEGTDESNAFDLDTTLETTFEAETARFAARLEEERADALAALAALEAFSGAAAAPDGAPFSRWSAYVPWGRADAAGDEANANATDADANANASAFATTGLGSAATPSRAREDGKEDEIETETLDDARDATSVFSSPADRRRDARRRARRSRVEAAAAAAAALALARRSLDAGGLVPLLRRWRSARDDDVYDAEARRSNDGSEETVSRRERGRGLFTLASRRDADAVDGREEGEEERSVVSPARADAAARAVADADAALARAEARLEAAEKELGLVVGGDDADADAADLAAAAAADAALAAHDALFAEAEQPSADSPPVSPSAASPDSEDAKTPKASDDFFSVETRAEALFSGGAAAALGGLAPEAASEVAARAMRRALREVVSAAEEAARARAFAAKASVKSAEKDGAALARRARARGAASREALDAAASRTSAAEAAGGLASGGALACLRAAVEGDETLAALAGPSATETGPAPGVAALAACVAETALRLSDARVARAARARAAARALAPLEAHLDRPPPRALGRFPQLRALLKAERASARGAGAARDERALRALPFVTRREDEGAAHSAEALKNAEARDGSSLRPAAEADATARGSTGSRWRLAGAAESGAGRARFFDADVAPFLEERGDWGARVAFAAERCPRCALPLRFVGDGEDGDGRVPAARASSGEKAAGEADGVTEAEVSREEKTETTKQPSPRRETFVAFPCGHAFHARCVPEDACVECLRLRGERLPSPAPAAHREGVAANAALEALFPST